MDSDPPVFARRLKEARQQLGISQYALGVAAGIDEMSASPRINQYERGKHAPDYAMARRLAGALGVPIPYLYADDDRIAEALRLLGRASEEHLGELLDLLRADIQVAASDTRP